MDVNKNNLKNYCFVYLFKLFLLTSIQNYFCFVYLFLQTNNLELLLVSYIMKATNNKIVITITKRYKTSSLFTHIHGEHTSKNGCTYGITKDWANSPFCKFVLESRYQITLKLLNRPAERLSPASSPYFILIRIRNETNLCTYIPIFLLNVLQIKMQCIWRRFSLV